MEKIESISFCDSWLKAWSGNRPEQLMTFYSDSAFYQDPGLPKGIFGKNALLDYFTRLLRRFPNWEWKRQELYPTEKGFVLKWEATIDQIKFFGMDIVEIIDSKITRNEVYFDASALSRIGK